MVKNLRLLREEMGISQKKLADMLSISQQAIFKYERTSNEPDISTLIKLAEIFDVTVDFLIGNSEIRENNVKKKPNTSISGERFHSQFKIGLMNFSPIFPDITKNNTKTCFMFRAFSDIFFPQNHILHNNRSFFFTQFQYRKNTI